MGFILAIGVLMLVSLAASTMFDAAGSWAGGLLGSQKALAEGINFNVSYLLPASLLALIYRFMPEATIRWRDVGVGALVAALLFVVGKFLIELYIAKSALRRALEPRALFLFGAEFTWAHANLQAKTGAGPGTASTAARG